MGLSVRAKKRTLDFGLTVKAGTASGSSGCLVLSMATQGIVPFHSPHSVWEDTTHVFRLLCLLSH